MSVPRHSNVVDAVQDGHSLQLSVTTNLPGRTLLLRMRDHTLDTSIVIQHLVPLDLMNIICRLVYILLHSDPHLGPLLMSKLGTIVEGNNATHES